jgi:ATP-dependent DNA helicase RecG
VSAAAAHADMPDGADVPDGRPPRRFAGEGAEPTRAALLDAPVRSPRPSALAGPLAELKGKSLSAAQGLGLHSVGDLLEHLPRDVREARTIATLAVEDQATLAVRVQAIRSRPVRRRGMRPLVEATVADATGRLRVAFFNQPWLVERYPPGTSLVLHGTLRGPGRFSVSHHAPGEEAAAGADSEGGAVAHYPATEGLSSTQILTLVQAHRGALRDVAEALPGRMRAAEGLADRGAALAALHFPAGGGEQQAEAARRRLAFEELLLVQLAFLRRRARRGEQRAALALAEPPSLTERWLAHGLPFELTADQRTAQEQIARDLALAQPMQRLLMGEVGAGKTVLALYAMLRAVEHGAQAALMAPTETLAEQHFATLQRLMPGEAVPLALLTGSTPARRRREILGRLGSGELSLLVGTHALIEPDVRFACLAVTVVDEQHRFGVRQRAALDAKAPGGAPHALHLTATPIPRTLALSQHGDLDVTALRALPRGRQPITTRVASGDRARAEAYELIRGELAAGRQAFVVCPLVEASEEPLGAEEEARAATVEVERLRAGELADYRLVLMHGQMRPREKQGAMAGFASGEADVLVATTVIEVGIDVPNATVMLVENAERYGISQLHQLRGRIGRGEHASTCLLLGPGGSPRLRALARYRDGFKLAEIDLELRREGELIGTRQSGIGRHRFARLPDDARLLDRARAWAETIAATDLELASPEHVLLGEALERTYGADSEEAIPA